MSGVTRFAQVDPIDPGKVHIPMIDANSALHGLLNAAYTWAGVICVLVIIVAGYFYVTSSGDAARVKKAKEAIFGAVIGLVLILMAFAITTFVIRRF